MAERGTVRLKGASGATYWFKLFELGAARFGPDAAVYAVTWRHVTSGDDRSNRVIYVGETHELPRRFDSHPKADCFRQHHANCVCTYMEATSSMRRRIASDLIANYKPPCND